jgi:c-di-GMP-binding flagellar brake protein YcgR
VVSEVQGPGGQENRKFKRVGASFPVVYNIKSPFELRVEIGKGELSAVANDLSQGGLSLLTNHEIPPGAVIEIKFRLFNKSMLNEEDRSRKFVLQGEARYCFFNKEKSYRLGIRFMDVSQTDRSFIAGCVE